MTALSHGYVMDVPYVYDVWTLCAPAHLRFTAVVNGYDAPSLDGFTFLELGCGYGFQVNLFAAAYPESRFYGVDFNPVHCETGRDLARAAGLGNVEFLCESFGDLAAGGGESLPDFDFVVLHGVYTWVNEESRRAVVEILRRKLKPGGLVYISYNTLPGGLAVTAFQRLFFDYGRQAEGSSAERVRDAVALARRMERAGAVFFARTPEAKELVERYAGRSGNYLAHEFMHEEWRSFYFSEVNADLAAAEIGFVGSANLMKEDAFHDHALPPELNRTVRDLEVDVAWRQTLIDFGSGAKFRSDVFQREARRLPPGEAAALLDRERIVLQAPPGEMSLHVPAVADRPRLPVETLARLRDLLDRQSLTVGEIAAALGDVDREVLVSHLRQLADQNVLCPARPRPADPEPCRRFNDAVSAEEPLWGRYRFFASPVLGNGVEMTHQAALARLATLARGELPPCQLAEEMEALLATRTLHDGHVLYEDEVALRAEFARFSQRFGPRIWPLMRKMGVD